MLKIIALICSAATPNADCNEHTALDSVFVGRAIGPMQCGFLGQALVAPTAIAPEPGKTYLVIRCVRADTFAIKAP
jgi:hypothetical protein